MQIDPVVDWGNTKQWENVYAPSSDTFFLCDGIKQLSDRIPNNSLILEVGSGSGYVTAYASRFLKSIGKNSIHFTTDININCCFKTLELCSENNVSVNPVCDNFALSLRGPFDVIIFNPPYVETSPEELQKAKDNHDISASWAGGVDGAEVIYDFLNFWIQNPSKIASNFLIILLITQINRPLKLKRFCRRNHLEYQTVLDKNCQGESLKIVAISPEKT
ncbi:S-adenosylmethionine-dependent methyltransferase [Tritrichomonas musculus]|uniref:S-adenosylmethionine-dependent methyltransferase n=1 Tax=Tritrichomonas musculus TaxID=1915356 RepID=A0ABR2KBL2_9EUKA